MLRIASAFFSLALVACSPALTEISLPALAAHSARSEVKEGGQIKLDVWVKESGELLLFDSREAMELGLVYPYCISAGLAPSAGAANALQLDGKRVQVRGVLLRYDNPPKNAGTLATSAVINGMFFKNWCFGPYVLSIEELTVI